MRTANAKAFIDKYHPQKNKKCAISIRVTFQRKKRYYPTGLDIYPKDFERITNAKRRSEADNYIYKKIQYFESKTNEVIDKLPVFTFEQFENLFYENRGAVDSIKFALEKYAKGLREEKRIGTAVTCEAAAKSIESFKAGLKFADITKSFLIKYENWMLGNGKSKTTVGIYLRALRTVFNMAKIDSILYPFGDERKGKYSIPASKNIKKALTTENIAKIYHYEANTETLEAMAKDYWIFLYLSNGMNVKDFALLKRKNIVGNLLKFERAKTKRTRKESKTIEVSLKPQQLEIMKKWGQPSLSPESYIFPHLQKEMTAEREREITQQLTKNINNYMKKIAKKLGIDMPVTTYTARHSFATILKRSGANVSFISDALGHSNVSTTDSYLSGFEEEAIHKTTDALIIGF